MKGRVIVAMLLLSAAVAFAQTPAPAQTPLQRLEASIQRTTRSIQASWGI